MREVMNTQNAQMANQMVLTEDEPYDLDGGNLFFRPSAVESHEAWKCQVLMTSHIGREGNSEVSKQDGAQQELHVPRKCGNAL